MFLYLKNGILENVKINGECISARDKVIAAALKTFDSQTIRTEHYLMPIDHKMIHAVFEHQIERQLILEHGIAEVNKNLHKMYSGMISKNGYLTEKGKKLIVIVFDCLDTLLYKNGVNADNFADFVNTIEKN